MVGDVLLDLAHALLAGLEGAEEADEHFAGHKAASRADADLLIEVGKVERELVEIAVVVLD